MQAQSFPSCQSIYFQRSQFLKNNWFCLHLLPAMFVCRQQDYSSCLKIWNVFNLECITLEDILISASDIYIHSRYHTTKCSSAKWIVKSPTSWSCIAVMFTERQEKHTMGTKSWAIIICTTQHATSYQAGDVTQDSFANEGFCCIAIYFNTYGRFTFCFAKKI